MRAAVLLPIFVLAPERGVLYRRIDGRFEAMLSRGALEEVSAARRLDPRCRHDGPRGCRG